MQIINAQYKVLSLESEDRYGSVFVVEDIDKANQKKKLRVINYQNDTKYFIDFMKSHIYDYWNIIHPNITEIHFFNRIILVEGKQATDIKYYYTFENYESENLFRFCKAADFETKLDLTVQLCKAICYLHLKNYLLGNINNNELRVIKNKEKPTIKILSLCYPQDAHHSNMIDMENNYFKAPEVFESNKYNEASDIYLIGAVMLHIFCTHLSLDFDFRSNFNNFDPLNDNLLCSIKKIIKRCTDINIENRYSGIEQVIKDINKCFGTKYDSIDKKYLQVVPYSTSPVARDHNIKAIIQNTQKHIFEGDKKAATIISGESGTGKNHFISYMVYRLQMEGIMTFSKDSVEDAADFSFIVSVIKDIYNYVDKEIRDKYLIDLSRIAPEITNYYPQASIQKLSQEEDRARLIYRLGNFLLEFSEKVRFALLIKNIEKVDLASLSIIEYIINNENKNKAYFIASSDLGNCNLIDSKAEHLKSIVDNFVIMGKADIIRLSNFSINETVNFVRLLLGTKEKPMDFAAKLYKETEGNPYLTYEIIYMAYTKNKIFVDDKGKWVLDKVNFEDIKADLSIDNIIWNKVKNLGSDEREILEICSIFNSAASVDIIDEMHSCSEKDIFSILNSLSRKNIMSKRMDDWGITFDFISKNIKKAVYESINDYSKIKYHEKAANLLEDKFARENRENKDELIHHMIRAGRCDEAIDYLISAADRIFASNLIHQSIQFLEQSYLLFSNDEVCTKKVVVCKKLGDLYKQLCNYDKALYYYDVGEKAAESRTNIKFLIDICISKFYCLYQIGSIKKSLYYATKAKKLLKKANYENGYYELIISLYDIMFARRKYRAYERLVIKSINACDEQKNRYYYAMLIIYYGKILRYIRRQDEAIDYLIRGSKLLEKIGAYKQLPIALNSMGGIYLEYYNDLNKAKEYYEKCMTISERMNIVRYVESCYNNLAEIYRESDSYIETIEYYAKGLELTKTTKNKYVENLMHLNIANVYLVLCEYKKAREHMRIVDEYFSNWKDVGDLNEYYYQLEATYNCYIGNYEDSVTYAQKSIDMCTTWGINMNMESVILKAVSLTLMEKQDYDMLYTLCLELFEKNLFKLGRATCGWFASISLKSGKLNLAKKLYDLGISYIKSIDTEKLRLRYNYIEAMLSTGSEKLNKLISIISKADEIEDKDAKCTIFYSLAKVYSEEGKPVEALRYYIYSLDYLKKWAYNIPDEHKLLFVNGTRKFIKEGLIQTLYQLTGHIEVVEELTLNDFDRYFNTIRYKDMLRNIEVNIKTDEEFIDKEIISSHLYKLFDIVNKFTDNNANNLKYIVEFCAEVTHAKNAFIATMDEDSNLNILSQVKENNVYESFVKYIVEQTRQRKESILITDAYEYGRKKEDLLIPGSIASIFCIPITIDNSGDFDNERRKYEEHAGKIAGYIYMDTDSVINSFTPQSSSLCMLAAKLAYILVENHNLRTISAIDRVTKLYTRKYFETMLQNEIRRSRHENKSFSILMIDIDRFKSVNDRFGHQKGDEVLQNVASIVMSNIRETDISARYGGEEFIILLPNTDSHGARSLAEKLRKKVEDSKLLGLNNSLTISIGISSYPEHSTWEKDLIEKADQALYFAKENNRNRSIVYKPDMSKIAKRVDKISGIISGDMVEDQRNVETMLEIVELTRNYDMLSEQKMIKFLGRVIEISEANTGNLFFIENKEIKKTISRKLLIDKPVDSVPYNEELVRNAIIRESGGYLIDWSKYFALDNTTGMPDWQSVLIVPITIRNDIKGLLYLSVSIKKKEFDAGIFNFIRTLCDMISVIF